METMKMTTALNLMLAVISIIFGIMLLMDGLWKVTLGIFILNMILLAFNLYALIQVAKEEGLY